MDSTALPTVPPPAPGSHPWRDRILALVFIALVTSPAVALVWTSGRTSLRFEHRAAEPWPTPTFERAYPGRFERWFGDRFGWRDTLLAVHHAVLADFFRVSPAPNVLLGKEQWLYFLGEDGTALDVFFRGQPPVADRDILAVAAELERRARFLASHGIPYVATIVPEKYTIYPEHLPDWVGPRSPRAPLDRLIEAIRARGQVRFVDLRGPLRDAKVRERLYFASDSHWNLAGATVAYEAIMREVQRALPGRLPSVAPAERPPYVPGVDVYRGDLARMAGYRPRFDEPDYVPLGKVLANAAARCARRADHGEVASVEVYECERAALPRAVIYRDSMAIALIPLWSENFGRVVYVSSRRLDPELVLREDPDIVIDEVVERALFGAAAEPMPGRE
jgi:hypothetical protein